MNFQVTVLKILVSYPDGFAVMADLKRDMAILATSGRDWAERTKRLAARMAGLDIFSQALLERLNGGWRITDGVNALVQRGHIINRWGAWNEMAGHAHGITLDPQSGMLSGGSDPRSDGAAIGY